MNVTPLILPPVVDSSINKVDVSYWNKVMDAYEAKNYNEVILNILNYVDPALIKKTGNPDSSEFVIPHGSAIVKLNISKDTFSVEAPFLLLPEKNVIPLLRQVTQINFAPLVLAEICLKNDQLYFTYNCPLSLCEPYKIYYVLREICVYADTYDDEFIKKFAAKRLREPVVQYFSKEKLDEMWDIMQRFIADTFQYIKYFTEKRWDGSIWDIIVHTLFKIEYTIGPQGQFRNELEKNIGIMLGKGNLNELNVNGQKYLLSLQNYKREEFDKDIYFVENFIPYKTSMSNVENLKSFFEADYKRAQNEMNANNRIAAAFTLYFAIFKCFYYHNISSELAAGIRKALEESGNKPWDQASTELMKCITSIMSATPAANN
jgi:hypothetical protein